MSIFLIVLYTIYTIFENKLLFHFHLVQCIPNLLSYKLVLAKSKKRTAHPGRFTFFNDYRIRAFRNPSTIVIIENTTKIRMTPPTNHAENWSGSIENKSAM